MTALTVDQAIAAVMGDLPPIGKNDRAPEGYAYRGIEDITAHVQQLMAKYGLTIAPVGSAHDLVPSPAMKEGWTDFHLRCRFRVAGADGSHFIAETNGIGRDRSDKGASKAHTQAYKTLLIELFCIGDRAHDPDAASDEAGRDDRPKPEGLSKVAAKKWLVQEFLGKGYSQDEAKADAGRVWEATGLERGNPWTPDKLRDAMAGWLAGAEPFDAPEVLEVGDVTIATATGEIVDVPS